MDYSKLSVNKKIRQLKTTTTRLSTKVKVSAYRLFLVFIVFFCIVGAMAAFGTLEGLISSSPDISNINMVPTGYTTKFYYADGTLAQTLVGAGGNREYVTIDEIPKHVQHSSLLKMNVSGNTTVSMYEAFSVLP